MAEQLTTEYTFKGLKLKQIVNLDNGDTEVFLKAPFFPATDTKIISSSGDDGKTWTTDPNNIDYIVRQYNQANPQNQLSKSEFTRLLYTDGTKKFNNERAAIINKNADPVKQDLFFKNGIPGVSDPNNSQLIIDQNGDPIQSPNPPGPQGPQAPVLPEPGVDIQDPSNPYNYIGGTATNPKIQFSDTLIYPLDIAETDQDRIKFTAADINGRSNQGTFSFERPIYKSVSPPVYISIQSPISDQNTVDWGEGNLNPLDATLYNSALRAMNTNGGVGGALAKGAMGLEKALEELKDQFDGQKFNQLVASLAAGNPSIFTRATSLVLNPNLELLFRGPQLRPFNFTFLMSARNSSEVYIIKEIIRYFKYHMAVREVPGGLFLKAPYVFKIQYQKGNQLHKSINLIAPDDEETKACALINFSVDYTPLGSYMTYETYEDPDATMVAYRLNMQFQEITPVYDTDYIKSPATNHPIGY